MIREACCILCLSDNRRTINIYDTYLRHVYENLANLKVGHGMCWMCYICHARLQQYHRLQQLAIQTRGLIDVACDSKMEKKFGAFKSLLELTISETKTACNLDFPAYIKEEPDDAMKYNESEEDSIDEYKLNPLIKSCPDSDDDPLINIAASSSKDKALELVKVKQNPSINNKYSQHNPTNDVITKKNNMYVDVPETAPCINDQSSEKIEIKIEIGEEIEQEIEQETEQEMEDKERDDETTSTPTGSRGPRGKNAQYYRDYRARKRAEQERESSSSSEMNAAESAPPRKRKSAAEYQREYRARKKAKRYSIYVDPLAIIPANSTEGFIATHQLTIVDQLTRPKRKTPAEYQREYRERKKAQRKCTRAAKTNDGCGDC